MLVAKNEIGVREIPGEDQCGRIVEYLAATRLDEQALNEGTAWCAAFVSWVLENSGMKNPKFARARNYLKYGKPVVTPQFGDVVVFSRGANQNLGHVGFYVADVGADIELLSGNSGNSVRYSHESKADILGFRRPIPK
jgi:uncharacterized protein (TIGR02594 family)